MLAQKRHEGVACFVVSRVALFLVGHQEGATFGAHAELVARFLEVEHRHFLVVEACGEECGFVHQVLEVGTGKSRRALRDGRNVYVLVQRNLSLFQVNFQNLFAALQVGQPDHDLPVETSRTQQSLVEHVGAVGGSNQDDAFVCGEAVHFHEQLVERLFAFVVPASEACATLATHGVNFVDEQNAGRVPLAGLEQVAHAACAHANEHLHEVGTRHAEERHAGFACDCTGKQSLAGARRPDKQCTLRDASTEFVVLFRVLQKFHEFLQILLGLVAAGDIAEHGLFLVVVQLLHLALAETERVLATAAHLPARHDPEECDEEENGEECDQRVDPCCRFVDDLDLDALVGFPCRCHLVCDIEHVGLEMLLVRDFATGLGKAGDGALLLLGLGDFLVAHHASALDNHAVGSPLQRKFGNDLGGVAHHGEEFRARHFFVVVVRREREHDEEKQNHNNQDDEVPVLEGGGGLSLHLAHFNPFLFEFSVRIPDTNKTLVPCANTWSESRSQRGMPFSCNHSASLRGEIFISIGLRMSPCCG